MTLFSRGDDAQCHWVRFALAEKALDARLIETDVAHPPEDLIDLNPYQTVPTLIGTPRTSSKISSTCRRLI